MTPDALRAELLKPWRHGEHFDGHGLRVDAALDLSGRRLRGFDLSEARFAKTVDASQAELLGLAWFQKARFDASLRLAGATCRFDLRLEEIECPTLDLTGLRMEGVLWLDDARVGKLILTDAVLLANLSLARAEIGEIEAKNLEIMGGIWTHDANLDLTPFRDAHIEGRV
ncbi:pentapeptide repeat-containing protein [Thalassococcus sp. S3]|uniref:pentapeptide repeat-containing protein n=1 Tax=Thalassococcus sp. S3 TaxID=2017482 RepID=UPI001024335B|nr:pentapeptide repeat-containing protein [Thalassococcus sp. S3]QBF33431.1 hypothetical protein CFI11_19775 [Thalassococcus sp. S3]